MEKKSRMVHLSEFLDELQIDLNNDEIDEEFNNVLLTTSQIIEKKTQIQHDARKLLHDLKEKCEHFEHKAAEAQNMLKRKYARQLKNLKEQKRKEEGNLHTESDVLEEITNKMDSIKLDQKNLVEKEIKLKHKQNVDIERDRTTFKLLSNTLKIKWDYSYTKDKIQGFVSGKSPVPFVLREQDDRFETVNHLWELIELSDQ